MKRILFILLIVFTSCFKDKGNYDYTDLSAPVVANFDSVYTVFTGDSLVISPVVTLPGGKKDMTCTWKINIPEQARSDDYEGPELRILFGLGASTYSALFTVTDNSTGMKYFYKFSIAGKTAFTTGTIVLSDDAGGAKLSFIKPDGTVQPDLYQAINKEPLGTGAMQLVPVRNQFYMNVIFAYWIVCSGGVNPAVRINSDNLEKEKYIRENFYEAPASIVPGYFQNIINGTTTAIMNDQLFIGTSETAPFATYYGYYGVPVSGNYRLAPDLVFTFTQAGSYYLGFDKVKRNLVRFNSSTYFGTDYTQEDSVFNPKDLRMDLIEMEKISEDDVYAFCRDSTGKAVELKFSLNFMNGNTRFKTLYQRPFPGDSLLTAGTRWQSSPVGVFYFSAGDKIYRYNPLNKEIRQLNTDFGGKAVTMIKLWNDGNVLLAGVQGSLYWLDVSTGKYGAVMRKVDGIPGNVKDVVIRE